MTEDAPAPKAHLFDGSGRARIILADRTWEDVAIVPVEEGEYEPADIVPPVLVVRPAFETAVAVVPGKRIEGVELYHATVDPADGTLREDRVRVRELRERKPKTDPFWNRVFRKK